MGIEFGGGTLYIVEPDNSLLRLSNNLCGCIEIDTCSTNTTQDAILYLQNAASASFSSEMTLAGLGFLDYKPFEPAKTMNIEYDIGVSIQAKWHKKKRINKKWLKRYGMKSDKVKIKVTVRTFSYNTETGDYECEADKFEYIWRPDQLRNGLKIVM